MADNQSVFRKVSLDRLSSPEQLDKKLTIVSPIGWLALIAMFIVVTAGVVWGFFGVIAEKVSGSGIMLYGDGIVNVISSNTGQITDVSVQEGDYVTKGQTLARIAKPEIISRMQQVRDKLQSLDGIDTDTYKVDHSRVNFEIYSIFSPLSAQIIEYPQIQSFKNEFINQKSILRRELTAQMALLQQEISDSSTIIADTDGTILNMNFAQGDFVGVGSSVFSLANAGRSSDNIQLLIYVPVSVGKRITEGMSADISPSTVNPQEYGKILGRVKSISDYVVSAESISTKLNSNDLVQTFMSAGPVLEVQVELLRDMNTVSGYKWSTSEGPNEAITAGVICSGEFYVSTYRPIELVLPFLKKIL